MTRILPLAAWTAAAVISSGFAPAHAEGHAMAARAGALGLGVEYAYSINTLVGVRFGWNGSGIGFDAEESGVRYDFDLVWDSISAAVDLHPTRGPLRISGGLLRNDNRLEALAQASNSYTIGDTVYSPEQIGTLTGRVGFDDTAPFVGVGWDWSRTRQRFGVSLDLGIVKQGAPQVSLTADGDVAGAPAFAADVAAEEAELRDSLEDFDLLPFASLGLVFRF